MAAGDRPGEPAGGGLPDVGVERCSDGGDGAEAGLGLPARHRAHLRPGRSRRVRVLYSAEELSVVRDAAARVGLTPTGFVAAAALAAARGQAPPAPSLAREALAELVAARAQVRRLGSNLNQAVVKLNSGEDAPVWLARAVALGERAVGRVDAAAAVLARRLS